MCAKYTLIKAPKKPADAREQKIGEALLNVTKSPDILQLINKTNSCCGTNCYKFIFEVEKAE